MSLAALISARLRRLGTAFTPAVALGGLLLLAACATPAGPERMSIGPLPTDKPFAPQLVSSMCVRNVTGGEETNPLWVSQVGSPEFKQALETSLRNQGLLAKAPDCKYIVDANLLGLSQPVMGFDLDVTSNINYKAMNAAEAPFLLETISALYTANFSEHPIAIVRLKRGNEGSIRANITKFMQKLQGATPN